MEINRLFLLFSPFMTETTSSLSYHSRVVEEYEHASARENRMSRGNVTRRCGRQGWRQAIVAALADSSC